ncbi:MAG TPA: glucose-1-phosphate adenylyltransferase [Polyangia bacterium]|jgi:glucose-1-phosphate adenylyltransferase|nr:glucose-1-phosphate adenylyltransferase [Polyangia bacterium]
MDDVLAVILGGGRGTRLFPLTYKRSKPAVPIAGKYRLIDIPISNCLNSNLRRIYILTQFNSESLNKHIGLTYKFDIFSSGFVSVLAAEQTDEGGNWFQGTADAVRQSLRHMHRQAARDVLILSGDQLYQMDYRQMLKTHRESQADATVAVIPVAESATSQFGILKMDAKGRITHFDEKPPVDRLGSLVSQIPGAGGGFLASMGIYIFTREALEEALANPRLVDFGRHVIPDAVPRKRVQAHVYQGYWEDVGTIQSYFQANLALCEAIPPFDFYDAGSPIYTHPRFLPASKVERCNIHNALISEGCILHGATIDRAVIGIRSRIGAAAKIRNSLLIGADEYETLEQIRATEKTGVPPIGVGAETVIENAIIDKNARIGRGVKIVNAEGIKEADGDGYFIREGIVIVPKNGVIADGKVI